MAVLGIGVSCVASVANAQGMPVPSQARPEFRDARPIAQPNPFDVAQEIMQAAPAKTGKTVQKQMRMRSFTKVAPKLKFHQRYALDKARQQAIYNELVRRFGPPKSIRGTSHVWDIKNPTAGGRQADILTIIFKMDKNGMSELIMDRDRGMDGRATWAAPRRKPTAYAQKSQMMQVQKVEQNND